MYGRVSFVSVSLEKAHRLDKCHFFTCADMQ